MKSIFKYSSVENSLPELGKFNLPKTNKQTNTKLKNYEVVLLHPAVSFSHLLLSARLTSYVLIKKVPSM